MIGASATQGALDAKGDIKALGACPMSIAHLPILASALLF